MTNSQTKPSIICVGLGADSDYAKGGPNPPEVMRRLIKEATEQMHRDGFGDFVMNL